jgi:hypothetical protein
MARFGNSDTRKAGRVEGTWAWVRGDPSPYPVGVCVGVIVCG